MNRDRLNAFRQGVHAAASMPDVMDDVSSAARYTRQDRRVMERVFAHQETPKAIVMFDRDKDVLSNHAYWFTLGCLWVSYTGFSDLAMWKRLFRSSRPGRDLSLMKPSELEALANLGDSIACFRVHRPGETDWIAYTLSMDVARRFMRERGVDTAAMYMVPKKDVLCLFLRRQEQEILVLDKKHVTRVGTTNA